MRLTKKERSALLAGDTPTLTRDEKPDVKPGAVIELAHSKPKSYFDQATQTPFSAPKEPSAWITITKVVRHRKGHWVVRYDMTDTRHPALMLAHGGGYTTDPERAIDRDEAELSQKDRKRLSAEARARYAEQRERDAEALKRQERAVRSRLSETLAGLSPLARQVLLAKLEKELERAKIADSADEAA